MAASDGPPSGLRPLLPRPASAGAAPTPDLTVLVKLAPRRPPIKNACERCRVRKIKCDGIRPACATCLRLAFNCVYLSLSPDESRSTAIKRKFDEAQDRVSSHEEFYTLLKTRGAAEVAEMLRRIRAGMDVDSVLRHVRDGDLVLQTRLTPETRMRYTFPEFPEWPTVFRDPNDPYLGAPLLDFQGVTTPPPEKALPDIHAYQMPYHAAHVVDPRLSSVRAATWTSVTSDDALVAKLLGIYFQHEYPRTPPFQKDLFLDDLVQGNTTFCSPLLVNAILANAAHGLASDPRRVEFWTPRSFPYAFLAEAKRLWELEIADGPKLTIIHAALPLSLRYSADGADKIGLPFVMTALEMADNMGLFTKLEKGNSRMSFGRAFTAWALFTWQRFASRCEPPYLVKPPVTPLPDKTSMQRFTGEIYLQYPLQARLTPTHLDVMFRNQVELSIIMLEINSAATRAGAPGTAPPTLGQALELYGLLETWYKALPLELQPDRVVMPQHLQLHMEYHLIIINLFDPWISSHQDGSANPTQADTLTAGSPSIRELGTLARARLETLIRLYYLRHSFDATDVMLILFLLMLGSISVRVLDSPTVSSTTSDSTSNTSTRQEGDASTFLLCAKGLHDQGRNHYIGALMFETLVGLVRPGNGVLRGGLARVRAEFEGIQVREEYTHMEWPVERWILGAKGRGEGRVVEEGSGDEEGV
ncbi:nitrogen assimilation transcription factor nirA [Staphylotrichum tortipilum]|uniref:Nitrogen assimilation transcription factor nirA n=1 Tax=Staphylotrichum tortipilum TaxID=2831512 RepID=A0AAN6MDA6_9PEZI|nr:nitrogen assimilation transcription factor nirA [Staphylotrichum longicolle]